MRPVINQSILRSREVTLIVVLYESEPYLDDLRNAIIDSASELSDIIFINNGARGCSDWITEHIPFASVEQNPKNVGHSGGLLQALQRVQTQYVIFSDHDTQWIPGTISRLVSSLESAPESVWAASPAVKQQMTGEIETGWRVGLFGTVCRSFKIGTEGEEPVESIYAPTTFLLIDLYRHCPQIVPAYFVYFNDVDMLYQAATTGKRIRVEASCVVTHGDGTSISSRKAAIHPARAFLQTRNRWLFALSRLQTRTLLFAAPVMAATEAGNFLLLSRNGMFKVVLSAYRSLWSNRHLIHQLRKCTGESRTTDDYFLLYPCVGLSGAQESALGNTQKFALRCLRKAWSTAHARLNTSEFKNGAGNGNAKSSGP